MGRTLGEEARGLRGACRLYREWLEGRLALEPPPGRGAPLVPAWLLAYAAVSALVLLAALHAPPPISGLAALLILLQVPGWGVAEALAPGAAPVERVALAAGASLALAALAGAVQVAVKASVDPRLQAVAAVAAGVAAAAASHAARARRGPV